MAGGREGSRKIAMAAQWTISGQIQFEADNIHKELAVSPWAGHRFFAYDLVSFLKPRRIVELGTHYGCSFFSFLQACKDHGLATEVIAVDSWKGDEQAGFYGDEVFQTVKKTVETYFAGQNSRLVRAYFKDALAQIEDGSVDLLHIDGLHTYEAVSEDYSQWLCKLRQDGIVLFHDTASMLGYGTNVFWEEQKSSCPYHYSFVHSWGLGVLFPKGEAYYNLFQENNMQDKMLVYEYMAKYDLEHRQLKDHIRMVQERDKAIAFNETMIRERDKTIQANERLIRQKDEVIQKNEAMIRARDEAIRSNELRIQELREAEQKSEAAIRSRDEAIRANEAMIQEKDRLIAKCEAMIRDRDEAIKSNESMIRERDALIQQMEQQRG